MALRRQQREFAAYYVQGEPAGKAYRLAYQSGRDKPLTEAACCSGAIRLLRNPELLQYVELLEEGLYSREPQLELRRLLMEIAGERDRPVAERLKAVDALVKLQSQRRRRTVNLAMEQPESQVK